MRMGVDVGGTFTDLILLEDSGKIRILKVDTLSKEPYKSVIEGVLSFGIDISKLGLFVNASTLGTNIFFGQEGLEFPEVVLVTNKGFEDIIEIGRQNRPELYDLFFEKPRPLVPRRNRYGVRGRIASDKRIIEDVTEEEILGLADKICGANRSPVIVVSLLNSYLNPSHERRIKSLLEKRCKNSIIVCSHEVDPLPMEYERTSSAVINAMLKPLLENYLERVYGELKKRGFKGVFLAMQSSGGVASLQEILRVPATFIESGPAAGAIATAYLSSLLKTPKAIGFDMGGTTAKSFTVLDGEPILTDFYEVGGKVHAGRIVSGSGYPVRYPFIDIAEVSAGGGSIAWVDKGGFLRVGPRSAGAFPGPACYGKGGSHPTVTDANLVLGRLPSVLAGGRLRLDEKLARSAIKMIADKIGSDIIDAAVKIIRLVNTNMARAIRIVTVEKGLDPSEFVLFAFGGAGPLHAVELSVEVGIGKVVVPPYPGVFSALGLLASDFKHYFTRSIGKLLFELDLKFLENVFSELEEKAFSTLVSEGVPRDKIRVMRFVNAMYRGQSYSLTLPYVASITGIAELFNSKHKATYGFSSESEPIEVASVSVVGVGINEKPRLEKSSTSKKELSESKKVFDFKDGWVDAEFIGYDSLGVGDIVYGPSIISYYDSTLYIPVGYRGRVGMFGEIVVYR